MRRIHLGLLAAALVAAGTAVPAQAQGEVHGANSPGAVPDSYIVVLRDHIKSADVSNRYDVAVNHVFTATINGFSATMSAARARRIAADPAVEFVQQNKKVTLADSQNNPMNWGLDRIDQRDLPLDQTYYYSGDASNVNVYVLDTGVRTTHQTFGGRARHGYDFIDNDPDASDCHGHGTHVAGTVGGKEFGVAKGVTIHAVRVLDCKGHGTSEQVMAGMEWVTKNAKQPAVVNMSIGGEAEDAFDAVLRRSIESGIPYAVAAGNNNHSACLDSPAREPLAITVGATSRHDARASYSNFGTCLDIYAPGDSITSSSNDSDTAWTHMSGTSMASPHVAGVAALYKSKHPSATPQQIRDALVSAAIDGKVTDPGAGSPNKLLHSAHGITPPAPTPGCGTKTNANDVELPDAGEAIGTAVIFVGCPGKAPGNTKVVVKAKHPCPWYLRVDLIAPSGKAYRIQESGTSDGLKPVYTVNLSGEDKNGIWQLLMQDRSEGCEGALDSWSITLPNS